MRVVIKYKADGEEKKKVYNNINEVEFDNEKSLYFLKNEDRTIQIDKNS